MHVWYDMFWFNSWHTGQIHTTLISNGHFDPRIHVVSLADITYTVIFQMIKFMKILKLLDNFKNNFSYFLQFLESPHLSLAINILANQLLLQILSFENY